MKTVQEALIDKEWSKIDINVYFYWNNRKLENSGQIHIRSPKHPIGFKDGEIVHIWIDNDDKTLFIVNTGEIRSPGLRARETDIWRILTQGSLKNQDFDFKCRPLFDLLDINKTITVKGKKVRAISYLGAHYQNQFAIAIDLKQFQQKQS